MRGKDHARIHTGRNDRNGRPRGSRRRTSLNWDKAAEAGDVRTAAYQAARHQAFLDAINEETEAWDEGLDGLYPDETPQA